MRHYWLTSWEEGEALDHGNVFNIDLLANRLLANAQWLHQLPETHGLRVGYFWGKYGCSGLLSGRCKNTGGDCGCPWRVESGKESVRKRYAGYEVV